MDKKTYGTLASAVRVERPECADEGDLLVIPPGNPVRSMAIPSIARMGLQCGGTCRSDNRHEAVDRLFRGGKAGAPLVLRISKAQKSSAPSGRRAQMLALIGNGREAGGEPKAAIYRCQLLLVYNGMNVPRHVDEAVAADLMAQRVGEVMERLQQSSVSLYSGPLADVATVIAWQAFGSAAGVKDESRPRASSVPEARRRDSGTLDWSVGGNLGSEARMDVAKFLANWCPNSSPAAVTVTARVRGRQVPAGVRVRDAREAQGPRGEVRGGVAVPRTRTGNDEAVRAQGPRSREGEGGELRQNSPGGI